MQIVGYIKTSLIEWPGKISSVVFVPGCNFRCPFCHNADIIADHKRGLTLILEKQIFADLTTRKDWIEAVVVTGGEPTLQTDIGKFLKSLKELKFLTMVHTNGTKPEVVEKLIKEKLVDYWGMDLKGDFQNYSNYTNLPRRQAGYSNDQLIKNVQETMKLILRSGVDFEFRTTVVPGLHDLKNLTDLADQIKKEIVNCRWFLQQFRPLNTLDKDYLKIKPYSKEEMERFLREIKKIVPQTFLRGV